MFIQSDAATAIALNAHRQATRALIQREKADEPVKPVVKQAKPANPKIKAKPKAKLTRLQIGLAERLSGRKVVVVARAAGLHQEAVARVRDGKSVTGVTLGRLAVALDQLDKAKPKPKQQDVLQAQLYASLRPMIRTYERRKYPGNTTAWGNLIRAFNAVK